MSESSWHIFASGPSNRFEEDGFDESSWNSFDLGASSGRGEDTGRSSSYRTTSTSAKTRDSRLKNGGDLVWKILMVVLLGLIGAAAGFAYIYGLLSRDEKVTNKVRPCISSV